MSNSKRLQTAASLLSLTLSRSVKSKMTLKIDKNCVGVRMVIRLSGRLQLEHLDELKTQVSCGGPLVAIDLDGLTLVDVDAVRFLNACETSGVEIIHRSPYIREWMMRERERK